MDTGSDASGNADVGVVEGEAEVEGAEKDVGEEIPEASAGPQVERQSTVAGGSTSVDEDQLVIAELVGQHKGMGQVMHLL